jgi:hypothetical protein
MRVFIDLDGTLADGSHREHYLKDQNIPEPQRWANFFNPTLVARDEPMDGMNTVNRILESPEHDVVFLTARPASTTKATQAWLAKHLTNFNEDSHPVISKPGGSRAPAGEWKASVLKEYGADPFTLIDDSDAVRSAVSESFPDSTVMKPQEGWEQLRAGLDSASEQGSAEYLDEGAGQPLSVVQDDPVSEDYSDMDE